jgi:hypothetical protein
MNVSGCQRRQKMMKAFKADLIYGAGGTTKTSDIGWAALWYYQHTGKKSRLVSGDGGGWEPVQPLVDQGINEKPWAIGLWPSRVLKPSRRC